MAPGTRSLFDLLLHPPIANEMKASPEAPRDPLAGRLGHLTKTQEAAFTTLKQRVIEDKVLVPGPLSHQVEYDDATVIRYLRARRWNVESALKQLKATADWMTTEDIDTAYDEMGVEDFQAAHRLGPRYTGKSEVPPDHFIECPLRLSSSLRARDRAGNPITVFRMDSLSDEDIKEFNKDHVRSGRRTSIMTRTGTTFYLPLLNALPHPNQEVPIDSFTSSTPCICLMLRALLGDGTKLKTVLRSHRFLQYVPDKVLVSDCAIFSYHGPSTHMRSWTTRALRGYLQLSSTLFTAHLPETLGTLYIIGAPSIWSAVYGIAKNWFDEGTTSKFRVLSASEVFTGLSQTIDPKSIPEAYGGELKWHWDRNQGAPVLDQDARDLLGLGPDEFVPAGPLRYSESTGLQVVGKGRTEAELAYNGRGRRPAKEATADPVSNGTPKMTNGSKDT